MGTANHITVGGAPEGVDARLVLKEAKARGGPVIHVARDDKRMAAMAAALGFFAPDMPVMRFPGWDCLPYDRISPNAEISAARMATLAGLVHGMPQRSILLTTLNAATQRLPARDVQVHPPGALEVTQGDVLVVIASRPVGSDRVGVAARCSGYYPG